jgi:hypothetical protein
MRLSIGTVAVVGSRRVGAGSVFAALTKLELLIGGFLGFCAGLFGGFCGFLQRIFARRLLRRRFLLLRHVWVEDEVWGLARSFSGTDFGGSLVM